MTPPLEWGSEQGRWDRDKRRGCGYFGFCKHIELSTLNAIMDKVQRAPVDGESIPNFRIPRQRPMLVFQTNNLLTPVHKYTSTCYNKKQF